MAPSRLCRPIFREETFGPVAPIFKFKTEEEAIRLANDIEFGLTAYFYGRDIGRVWRVAAALECATVSMKGGFRQKSHHLAG